MTKLDAKNMPAKELCARIRESTDTALAVEHLSEHPLARAVCGFAQARGTAADARIEGFMQVPGEGLSATVDGAAVLAGRAIPVRASSSSP